MEKVTDRVSNPFGLDVPCREVGGTGVQVAGYGDPNADFHVVGDHPGRHGGSGTGVPFTETTAGRDVQRLVHEVGFAEDRYADEPVYDDLYCSYLYPCEPADEEPGEADYRRAERYFDAELRAVNAHVLLPVGERAVRHVLDTYTNQGRKAASVAIEQLHATELRGNGFMVIPIRGPTQWREVDRFLVTRKLEDVLASDYRQTKGVATRIG